MSPEDKNTFGISKILSKIAKWIMVGRLQKESRNNLDLTAKQIKVCQNPKQQMVVFPLMGIRLHGEYVYYHSHD